MVEEAVRGGQKLVSEEYGVLSEDIARVEVVWALQKPERKAAMYEKRWPHHGNDKQRSAGGPLVGAIQLVHAGCVEWFLQFGRVVLWCRIKVQRRSKGACTTDAFQGIPL